MGGQCSEFPDPVTFSMFHDGADFVPRQGSVVFDLFQENKSGVAVEAMAWGVEVFIER